MNGIRANGTLIRETRNMYHRVLIPLDGSELAECTLPQVISLAKGGNVEEALLLRVIKVNITHDYRAGLQAESFRVARVNRARRYLESVQTKLRSEGIQAKADVIEGENPALAIANYAQEKGVDLVIIASRGYTGVKKLVFGSVALKVLQLARMPVLLIKPEYCPVPEK